MQPNLLWERSAVLKVGEKDAMREVTTKSLDQETVVHGALWGEVLGLGSSPPESVCRLM